jgi:F-type H+-transporting ATPase subunit b
VKACLEAMAQAQGKLIAKLWHKLDDAAAKAIAAGAGTSLSEHPHSDTSKPSHLDGKAARLAQTNLSPLNWLLLAASCAGAVAALVILIGFQSLDKRDAANTPLKERLTALDKRIGSIENTEAALANRVTAAESAIAKSTSVINSAIAEIQKASARHAPPGEMAADTSAIGRIEKRVAILEKNLSPAAGTGMTESNSTALAASTESGPGEATFPPFDPVNFTPMLIWLTLSFGLLYILMSKIALPRVENILQARSEKISNDVSKADALRAKAEEAEKTIADARAKALALAQETHARLNAEAEAKRHALETELNARLAASEAQVIAMKSKAMENVDAIAHETAAAIVQHITGKPADQNAIARAIATIKA